ncbi:MAG: sulfatase [Planctomycetota bacterium]|nr:sulfatase [Planctomycetota bacterium]
MHSAANLFGLIPLCILFYPTWAEGCLCGSLQEGSPTANSVSMESSPPNFVIIFVDDLGYGDIEPFGSKTNRTPHLNRMAREGKKLTSFYVASPVCTPSRAALMTGCYPQRVGLARGSGHAVLFPGDHHGLHPGEVTIAEVLKTAGYRTGCFGKWHLGDQPVFLPTRQGFDEYFGIPYSNDMWPGLKRWPFPDLPILNNTQVVDRVSDMNDQATLCRRFTEKAIDFISRHRKQPFFVYLPHAFVHFPRKASPRFMQAAKTVEQAQVEEVDWSVGQILDALEANGVDENTLVIFTSDNGAAGGLSSGPLRGRKGSGFEGGHREPTLIRWPAKIAAASVSDELVSALDILPTFAGLAGARIPTDRVLDGKDILDVLTKPDGKTPHDRFFYQQGGKLRAVRSGNWKLFVSGELYNLESDLGEKTDLAGQHPAIVRRLDAMLVAFKKDIAENSRPVGVVQNPRTLVPRPGVEGEEGFRPTLSIPRKK